MTAQLAQARHGPAIAVMCLGVASLVMSDVIGKTLVARYAPLQILWIRSLLAAPVLAGIILWRLGPSGLRSHRPLVHVIRGIVAMAATWCFILSLRFMDLEAATSLIFTAPLFVAALSWPILGERVGRDRWIAIGAGFLGVLVVVRPGLAAFDPAGGLALSAAALYAVMMIGARWIDPRDKFLTLTFWITLIPAVLCSVTLLLPWPEWQSADGWLFAGTALCGTIGVACLSQAFRMAPASVVAPFDYTALFWASFWGWAVFGATPSPWIWAGAAVIGAGGLYLIHSERRARR